MNARTHARAAGSLWWADESILPALFLALCSRTQRVFSTIWYVYSTTLPRQTHTYASARVCVAYSGTGEKKKINSVSSERSDKGKSVLHLLVPSGRENPIDRVKWLYKQPLPSDHQIEILCKAKKFGDCDVRHSSILSYIHLLTSLYVF